MLATVLSPGRGEKGTLEIRHSSPEQGNIAAFLEGGREEQIEKERLKG
jgi:hypothetical protein